jgi:hypothetical protein
LSDEPSQETWDKVARWMSRYIVTCVAITAMLFMLGAFVYHMVAR